jgi:hypothetical protein
LRGFFKTFYFNPIIRDQIQCVDITLLFDFGTEGDGVDEGEKLEQLTG